MYNRPMDLNEVAIYIKVVQLGSFSQAAKQLGMPNSTVSAKVSSLETRLGITLIQRTTRKLNVTPAGQAYFKRCIQGLEEIKAAETEIAAIQGEPQGLLRITAPIDLGSTVLPLIVSEYTRKYPKVSIETLLTGQRLDLLSENIDLAIRAGELKDSSLIAKKLGSVYFAPFATAKYLKANGTPTHPRELRQHRCLHFSPIGFGEWKLIGPKGSLNVPITSHVITNDLMMVRALALMGDGIAMLPTHMLFDEVSSGKLVRVLPEWKSSTTPVHFVYPAQRFVTPKLSTFMTMASETIKKTFESWNV